MTSKTLLASLLVAVAFAFAASSSVLAAPPTLKPHHQNAGLDCKACHAGGEFKPVQEATCLKCHGSRDAVAAQTEKSEHNPHFGHGDEIACNACHLEHKPSTYSCEECHLWDVKTP